MLLVAVGLVVKANLKASWRGITLMKKSCNNDAS
jgi:hypothetical protein